MNRLLAAVAFLPLLAMVGCTPQATSSDVDAALTDAGMNVEAVHGLVEDAGGDVRGATGTETSDVELLAAAGIATVASQFEYGVDETQAAEATLLDLTDALRDRGMAINLKQVALFMLAQAEPHTPVSELTTAALAIPGPIVFGDEFATERDANQQAYLLAMIDASNEDPAVAQVVTAHLTTHADDEDPWEVVLDMMQLQGNDPTADEPQRAIDVSEDLHDLKRDIVAGFRLV